MFGRWMVVVLVGASLAGCVDTANEGGERVRMAAAMVDEATGGIDGLVTDVAISPLANIELLLVELDTTTESLSDGSFAFSQIPPGTYTLEATPGGYLPVQMSVQVEAGVATSVEFVMRPLASTEPYHETFELNGYLECAMTAGDNSTGEHHWIFKWSICGDLNIVQPNATNDRSYHHIHLAAPVEELIVEGEWDLNSPQSNRLEVMVQFGNNGVIIDGDMTMEIELSGSPMYFRLTKEHFEERAQWLIDACDADAASPWCGANPWDNGWDITFITHPDPECPCIVAQQSFDLYATAFYYEPAPSGFSLVRGS